VSRNGNTGISGGTRNVGVSEPLGSKGSKGLLTLRALRARMQKQKAECRKSNHLDCF
jgi:hypothetical protein